MATRVTDIEQQLWKAADELRANSNLSAQQYSVPVLGLIFLRYADARFAQVQAEIEAELAGMSARRRARADVAEMYQARGVMFVPEEARFARLVSLPEGADIGQAVVEAMKAIEAHNPQLKDVLPKTYRRFRDETLTTLLKNFNSIPMDIEGDAFGRIYE
jgi:type I restriction enzyme M protein